MSATISPEEVISLESFVPDTIWVTKVSNDQYGIVTHHGVPGLGCFISSQDAHAWWDAQTGEPVAIVSLTRPEAENVARADGYSMLYFLDKEAVIYSLPIR